MSENDDKPAIEMKNRQTDRLSPLQRSRLMSNVHGKDTKPEMIVRKELFQRGFRYRKNVTDLPGKPDVVLPKYRAVLFIHGCFWHQHFGCKESTRPRSRQEYWEVKLNRNIERDALNIEKLKNLGWRVYVIWECELHPRCRQQTIDKLIDALRSLKATIGEC